MTTQHLGYEWCLPPDDLRIDLPEDEAMRSSNLVAINTTAGWLVLVRHFQSDTGTTYSEYVRPSELRQKP